MPANETEWLIRTGKGRPQFIVSIEDAVRDSFKDYHVKGFDYLCLRRSETRTDKIYFFDGDVRKLPEVVNPHDHRYHFVTVCLSGAVENRTFVAAAEKIYGAECFQRFDYRPPLNGGNGFTWAGEQWLMIERAQTYWQRALYSMRAHEIHTIRLREPETVLWLQQLADVVDIDTPTMTFSRDREPPSLSGLYSKFTADDVLRRANQLAQAVRGDVYVFDGNSSAGAFHG